MKKLVVLCALVLVVTGFSAVKSEAGLLCYSADGFTDIFKFSVTSFNGQKLATGRWYTPSGYNIPIVGAMIKDSSGNKVYGFNGSVDGLAGNQAAVLNVVINPITKNGTWSFYMLPGGLSNAGTLTKISCSSAPAPFSGGQSSIEAAIGSN